MCVFCQLFGIITSINARFSNESVFWSVKQIFKKAWFCSQLSLIRLDRSLTDWIDCNTFSHKYWDVFLRQKTKRAPDEIDIYLQSIVGNKTCKAFYRLSLTKQLFMAWTSFHLYPQKYFYKYFQNTGFFDGGPVPKYWWKSRNRHQHKQHSRPNVVVIHHIDHIGLRLEIWSEKLSIPSFFFLNLHITSFNAFCAEIVWLYNCLHCTSSVAYAAY